MDETRDNQAGMGGAREERDAGAFEVPSEGDMPMLAGSAAARLTRQILARLASPHARHSTSPVRPAALWRQVARRLGIMPEDRPRPGAIGHTQEQAHSRQDPFLPPRSSFVWRAVSPAHQEHEEPISVEEMLASAMRPTTTPRMAQPSLPTQVQSPSYVQPPSQPQPSPIQTQPTPTQEVSFPSSPAPAVAPSKNVVVEYMLGPAALPLQPLVAYTPLIEPARPVARNLADSLNRDLVPTTDMISRRVPPSWEDILLPEARQGVPVAEQAQKALPVQSAEAAHRDVVAVTQPPATPVADEVRLEMPLAATSTASVGTQRTPTRSVGEAIEHAERGSVGPVRHFMDRVAAALPLPEAVRRFITGKSIEQPTPSGVEPGTTGTTATPTAAQMIAQPGQPTGTTPDTVSTPQATSGQASTPRSAEVGQPERARRDTISAPVPVSTPSAVEMPVRASGPATSSQQALTQGLQPAPTALGPFQPFQAVQPAQAEWQQQPQQVQQVQVHQAHLEPQAAPLGPYEPFQPNQSIQLTEPRPASQGQPVTEPTSTPSPPTLPTASSASPFTADAPQPVEGRALATAEVAPPVAVGEQPPVAPPVAFAPEPSRVMPATEEKASTPEEGQSPGFLGRLLGRLFGRGEQMEADEQPHGREESRTPPIQMPWVGRGRSSQASSAEPRTPGEIELPGTRITQPERPASPGAGTLASTTPATTTVAPAQPLQASQATQPTEPAGPSQMYAPAATGVVAESVPSPELDRGEAARPGIDTVSQDLPRVTEASASPIAPSTLDMPHPAQQATQLASVETEEMMQSVVLPSESVATPSNVTESEGAATQLSSTPTMQATVMQQAEAEPPQAWTLMPQVADALVRSHAPLSSVEPMETAAQSDLLARILGGLGQGIVPPASIDGLRAVPVPATGAGVGLPSPSTRVSSKGPTANVAEAVPANNIRAAGLSGLQPGRVATGAPLQAGPALPGVGTPQGLAAGDLVSPPELPVAPRYITNVTPATYLAEAAIMSPSPGNYSRFEEVERPARTTTILPLSEMSPTAASSLAQSEAWTGDQRESAQQPEQAEEPQTPWMAALQALYGQKVNGNDDMPLAIPFGAFALPSEPASPTSTWQVPGFDQFDVSSSRGQRSSQGLSPLQMPTPSVPSFPTGAGGQSATQYSQSATSHASSWSADSWSTDGYSEADSEVGAWADVVTSAVSGASQAAPSLALAAEERGSPQELPNTQDEGQAAEQPDLEELASSVLDIIRNKLLIERERSFG